MASEKKKTNKIGIAGIILDLCAVLLLIMVGMGTFRHGQTIVARKENGSHQAGTTNVGDERASGKEKSVSVQKGTWCTRKSNSLDGVPIYPEAGETFQVGLIPEGKCCELLDAQAYDGESWAQVSYCGQTGWLELEKLHFISAEACYIQQGEIVYVNALTEKGISGYAEASVSADKIIDGITYGMEFTVLELKNGWGLVRADGKEFWLNMYHMGSYPINRWKVETLSSAAEINFRESPDEKAKSLCKVPENTELVIEEFRNGWGKTQYDGQEGWVMLHYLTPVEGI